MKLERLESTLLSGVGRLYTGAALKVQVNGNILCNIAVGTISPSPDAERVSADSLFDLASLTKPLIATLAIRLEEEKKLDLALPVYRVFPQYGNGDKRHVTLLHLLSHTSGLPATYNFYEPMAIWREQRQLVMNTLLNVPLINTPGKVCLYSCLGFIIAGHMLERMFDKQLDVLLDEVLFAPYGLKDIVYCPSVTTNVAVTVLSRANRGALAPGIVHDGGAAALKGVAGNAGLFASANALTTFGQMVLDTTILSPLQLEKAIQVHGESTSSKFGIGWRLNKNSSMPLSIHAIGHTGFTGTAFWLVPSRGMVITLLTNFIYYRSTLNVADFEAWRNSIYRIIVETIDASYC